MPRYTLFLAAFAFSFAGTALSQPRVELLSSARAGIGFTAAVPMFLPGFGESWTTGVRAPDLFEKERISVLYYWKTEGTLWLTRFRRNGYLETVWEPEHVPSQVLGPGFTLLEPLGSAGADEAYLLAYNGSTGETKLVRILNNPTGPLEEAPADIRPPRFLEPGWTHFLRVYYQPEALDYVGLLAYNASTGAARIYSLHSKDRPRWDSVSVRGLPPNLSSIASVSANGGSGPALIPLVATVERGAMILKIMKFDQGWVYTTVTQVPWQNDDRVFTVWAEEPSGTSHSGQMLTYHYSGMSQLLWVGGVYLKEPVIIYPTSGTWWQHDWQIRTLGSFLLRSRPRDSYVEVCKVHPVNFQ